MDPKIVRSFRINPNLQTKLEAYAARRDVTISKIVTLAIEYYLEKHSIVASDKGAASGESVSSNALQVTLATPSLPRNRLIRWTASRKAALVNAVHSGLFMLQDVLDHYNMTEHEFRMWEQGLEKAGAQGLKVTKFREHRRVV